VTAPLVDVIIPVHRVDRNYLDAVRSAQPEVQGISTRVLLVLHGIHLDVTHAEVLRPLATVLRCDDGIPSPSGPRNVGLEAASAPFVSFVDSDDVLHSDCLRRLHAAVVKTEADVALPSILSSDGYRGTPLAISRSPRLLDIVRHDLFSRSHSFGLIRRDLLVREGLRYPPAIRAGQDLVLMARLFTLARTAVAIDAVYELRDHDGDRVTTTRLPREDQLAAARHLLSSPWLAELSGPVLDALAMRVVSVNLAHGWRRKRAIGHEPSADDHREVRDLALAWSSSFVPLLSVRDRVSLRFRTTSGRLDRILMHPVFGLVPSTPRGLFSPRGPFVAQLRNWAVRHRRRHDDGPVPVR
jgi:hypothetical protein